MDTYPYATERPNYPGTLLLTPGTVIPRPEQIPGMLYENYDTLEILEGYGVSNWLALARAGRESHVYRLTHSSETGMHAERIRVR